MCVAAYGDKVPSELSVALQDPVLGMRIPETVLEAGCIHLESNILLYDEFKYLVYDVAIFPVDIKIASLVLGGITSREACISDDIVEMREAKNKKKDQSYFLSLVDKNNLKYVRFPLGEIEDKSITRKMAEEFGLPNFEKEESQDICFIKHGNYKEFLHEFYANLNLSVPGDIVLSGTKQILGKHNGIENYTIGQRRGIGVSRNEPLYVVNINSKSNQVIVGSSDYLLKDEFTLFASNWILDTPNSFEAFVKLRSSCEKTKAKILN